MLSGISVIGQGTWNLELAPRAEAVKTLQRGIDLGMTHIDTAEMYGSGRAEALTGVPPQPGIEGQCQRHPADAPPGGFLEGHLVWPAMAHQHQVRQQRNHHHAGKHQPQERGSDRFHATLHR